jgi:hypothetical protein
MAKPQRTGIDLGEQKVLADISEYGWHCMNVVEDDGQPPWSFTIGLYETWAHPELIITGRSRATAHEMLSCLVAEIEDGRPPDLTDPSAYTLVGIPCRFLEVHARHYTDYVGFARWFYRGKHFPLYQIVWPSTDGLYPFDKAAPRSFKDWQPVLGREPKSQ